MKAIDLVGHIAEYSENIGKPVNNLRLQGLLYFIHKESMNEYLSPVFEDNFNVWDSFPVLADVYYEFSIYANLYIFSFHVKKNENVDYQTEEIIRKIVKKYKDMPTWKLLSLTQKDLAYKIAKKENRRYIPNKYFLDNVQLEKIQGIC